MLYELVCGLVDDPGEMVVFEECLQLCYVIGCFLWSAVFVGELGFDCFYCFLDFGVLGLHEFAISFFVQVLLFLLIRSI